MGDFEFAAAKGAIETSGHVKVTIRPERVRVDDHGTAGENRIPGMIERTVYLGSATQLIVNLAHGETLQALVQNQGDALPFQQGSPVSVGLPAEALRVLTISEPVASGVAPAKSAADRSHEAGDELRFSPPPA